VSSLGQQEWNKNTSVGGSVWELMANYNEHWPLAWKFMENLSRQIFPRHAPHHKKTRPSSFEIRQRLLFIHFTS